MGILDPNSNDGEMPTQAPVAKQALPNGLHEESSSRRSVTVEDYVPAIGESTGILEGMSFLQRKNFTLIFERGGLAEFLYRTFWGWHLYVIGLVSIVGACETGLVVLNRLIFMTGVWKFPYPVTTTFAQLLATHLLLVFSAAMTRILMKPLDYLGFKGLIAPSRSFTDLSQSSAMRTLAGATDSGSVKETSRTLPSTLPLAILFTLKVLLSNLSFAYTSLPKYTISRIHIVPTSLIASRIMLGTSQSVSTLSSSLAAVLYLGIASNQTGPSVPWDGNIAAFASAICVSLYPILFLKTFTRLVSRGNAHDHGNVTQSSVMEVEDSNIDAFHQRTVSAAAHWHLIRRISLLSVILFLPIVLLSGEIIEIWRNCYILDQYKLWTPAVGSFLTSFGVFVATPLLVRATSPLTATFVMIPRSAFLLAMLHDGMETSCWVGVIACYISSFWYVLVRRSESITLKRLRN